VDKPANAGTAARVDQSPGSLDIGPDKGTGVLDAAVDMAFGGKVNDGVAPSGSFRNRRVRYIHPQELNPGVSKRRLKIPQISGIGKLIENKYRVGRMSLQNMAHEVGANETSPTRDKNAHSQRAP
jgi:hypothetical protein